MYDPKQKKIHYCGHTYMPVTSTVSDLIPILNERAGFPTDTELVLYEEIRPNMIEKINNYSEHLEKVSLSYFLFNKIWCYSSFNVLEELMDGDIIVFEKEEREELSDLPTCVDYFKDLFYR